MTPMASGSRVRLRVIGEEAELGRIPASDVARLWLGLEAAMAQASSNILRRRLFGRGRRGADIEAATRLRLVELSPGSVVTELEIPEIQPPPNGPDGLELDVSTLGEDALEQVLDTALGEKSGIHPDVARSLYRVIDKLGIGTRYDGIELEFRSRGGRRRSAVFDATTRARLREISEAAAVARGGERLVGTLFEADFERNTARLRTPAPQPIEVTFEPALADDIQEALRRPSELAGEVTYDAQTGAATRITLRELTRAEQLTIAFDTDDFWTDETVEELQRRYGVAPTVDLDGMYDQDATDEEVDAFFRALGDVGRDT
jgi:hypothetical protein